MPRVSKALAKSLLKESRATKSVLTEKQAKAVKSLARKEFKRNVEFKHYTAYNSISVSTTATLTDLSVITQGDTDTSRDGDELRATTISMRYYVAGYDDTNFVRIILFQWHPDTTPIVADILNAVVTAGFLANYEVDRAENYKIMYDRTHAVVANYSGQQNTSNFVYKKLRIPRPKMKFYNATAVGTNKIWMLTISDSSVAAHPGVAINTKLNFYDA